MTDIIDHGLNTYSKRVTVVDSNGAAVNPTAAVATHSNVADSATEVTLLAANTLRKGASIHNDSTAVLYVKCATGASATSFTAPLAGKVGDTPGGHYEVPFGYLGVITGLWATAPGGAARVAEFV